MDPLSIASALSSSSSVGGAGSLASGSANTVVHQMGGESFRFQMPDAPQPVVEGGAFQPAQVYATSGTEPTSYGHMMQQMVRQVNDIHSTAGSKVRDVLMGGPTTVNDAMVAVQEAGVSFKLLSQVRNKLVDSYQEIMRMQV